MEPNMFEQIVFVLEIICLLFLNVSLFTLALFLEWNGWTFQRKEQPPRGWWEK